MKQIFNWLREQIAEKAGISSTDEVSTLCWVADRLNEAEAKWEADCCEWKRLAIGNSVWKTSCGKQRTIILNGDETYCPYCGKRIKISEVE